MNIKEYLAAEMATGRSMGEILDEITDAANELERASTFNCAEILNNLTEGKVKKEDGIAIIAKAAVDNNDELTYAGVYQDLETMFDNIRFKKNGIQFTLKEEITDWMPRFTLNPFKCL